MPGFMDETLARSLYRRAREIETVDGVVVTPDITPYTYGREFYGDALTNLFTNRASGMVSLGVATNSSILVVGSAFGYLMEALIAQGISDVWGIDPSGWCWDAANDSDWAVGMKARTANDWLGSGTEKTSLNAIGVGGAARFTFVVDEDSITMHSDAELPAFIAACEDRLQGNVKGRIIHLVTPLDPPKGPGDSSVNWKTLADWEAVAPDHTWVDVRTL